MHLSHPKTIPRPHHPPICGKTVFHKTRSGAKKVGDHWLRA